jgi:hypothetical protein
MLWQWQRTWQGNSYVHRHAVSSSLGLRLCLISVLVNHAILVHGAEQHLIPLLRFYPSNQVQQVHLSVHRPPDSSTIMGGRGLDHWRLPLIAPVAMPRPAIGCCKECMVFSSSIASRWVLSGTICLAGKKHQDCLSVLPKSAFVYWTRSSAQYVDGHKLLMTCTSRETMQAGPQHWHCKNLLGDCTAYLS